MSIKKWSEDDRPREKFYLKGKNNCSNSELLALLIGMGSKDMSALEIGKVILKSVDNKLDLLSQKSITELMKYKGIGLAKAVTIAAALELGNRATLEKKGAITTKITSSKDSFDLFKPFFYGLKHEEFHVMYLNNSLKVIKIARLSIGGISNTVVDIRLIAKQALESVSTSVILAHNHPSGDLKPSSLDFNVTQKVIAALKLLDIKLLDHLVIFEDTYYSMNDHNTMALN